MWTGLAEPVDVRIISDEHWYEPFLVPLAVILAGLLAGFLSFYLHRANLAAEDRRQQRRFDHDRKMRDREATRNLLDWVVEQIVEINRLAGEFASSLDQINVSLQRVLQVPPEHPERGALEREHLEALTLRNQRLSPAGEALNEAIATMFRLQLRFPVDHEIVRTFGEWHQAKQNWFHALSHAEEGTPSEEFSALNREAGRHLQVFLQAVRGWNDASDSPSMDVFAEQR
jgi:hypothetical protein